MVRYFSPSACRMIPTKSPLPAAIFFKKEAVIGTSANFSPEAENSFWGKMFIGTTLQRAGAIAAFPRDNDKGSESRQLLNWGNLSKLVVVWQRPDVHRSLNHHRPCPTPILELHFYPNFSCMQLETREPNFPAQHWVVHLSTFANIQCQSLGPLALQILAGFYLFILIYALTFSPKSIQGG